MLIRNRRPTRSANIVVQVEFDASDGFVLAGLRAGRIPILLPGGEEVLTWNAIPVECGYAKLPKIKVTDRRQHVAPSTGAVPEITPPEGEGEVVIVVDVRSDERSGASPEVPRTSVDLGKRANQGRGVADITVLVLP